MDKYALGTDIPIRWSLGEFTPGESVYFEIYTGAGRKRITDFTITDGVLSWTFLGTDQSAYGVYGLHLVSGSQEYRLNEAFELIHGTPAQQVEAQILSSSVEIDAVEQEPTPVEETAPAQYESPSPLYIEKIPLGSNIILNWNLLTPQEFDFDLTECELSLYYSAAGSGMKAATDYELLTDNGYTLQWRFPGVDQIRYGLYSLFMDVYKDGALIAVLEREYAFELVHRSGSDILADRIISFDSIVTTFGGGALFSLYDVLNDGHSTVYRSDGETDAGNGDILAFNGQKWYAKDGVLSTIAALGDTVGSLGGDVSGLSSRMEDAEGNISSLTQTASSIEMRVSDAEGDIGSLELTATALTGRMSNAEGDIGSLQLTASGLTTRITNAEGDIGSLELTAAGLTTRISNTEGDVSTLSQTATSLTSRISNAEGDVSVLQQTATGLQYQVDNTKGDIASLQVTAQGIHMEVQEVSGDLQDYEAITDAVLVNLQEQIDGVVETWYFEGVPTLTTPPVMSSVAHPYDDPWLDGTETPAERTEILNNHIGDLYYDKVTGKAYRFMYDDTLSTPDFVWTEIADEDVAKALALAGEKKRVFVSTPYPPYDVGDLWVKDVTFNSETTREIYKCVTARAAGATPDISNDWVPADDHGAKVNKANIEILANAITSSVAQYTYNQDGTLSSASISQIKQDAKSITLSVISESLDEEGSINDALLATGINITDQNVVITSNNFVLAGNGVGDPAALTLTYRDNVPYISAANLDVTGIFSAPRILSSEIKMLDTSNNVMSGLSGSYDTTETGYGLAAWYGGPRVDWADLTASERLTTPHAKTAFRMDGSGYLADGAISWGAAGDLHLLNNIYIGPGTTDPFSDYLTLLSKLATWFEDEEIVIDNVTKHVLRINMSGDTHDTGFAGVVFNGFLITGGDQIVGSGTPGGGGGGAGYLYELGDIYHDTDKTKVLRDPDYATTTGQQAQPGDVLVLDSTYGWAAVPSASIGGVTSVVGQAGDVTAQQISTAIGLGNYVAKSSSVRQTISVSAGDTILVIKSSTDASSWIQYNKSNGGTLGYIGVTTSGPAFYDTAERTIYHSGNSNSTSVAWSASSLTLANEGHLYFKDNATTPSNRSVLYFSDGNTLNVGFGTSAAGYNTYVNGNNLYLRYGTSRTIGLILNSSGNVGIGTSSPSEKLEVNGNVRIGGNSIIYRTDNNTTWNLAQNTGITILNSVVTQATGAPSAYESCLSVFGYYGFQISSNSTSNVFRFRGANSTTWANWVTMYHSGNLTKSVLTGLLDASGGYYLPLTGGTITGTSATPLAIKSSNDTESWIRFLTRTNTSSYIGYTDARGLTYYDTASRTVYHSGNSNSTSVAWKASSLTLPNGGSVDIQNSSSSPTSLNTLWVSSGNDLHLGYGVASNSYNTYINGYNIIFRTNSNMTERVRINSSGNVGIGTNSPSDKLHVAGNFFTTGKIRTGYFSTNRNAAQFIFDKAGTNLTGIGANNEVNTIYLGACDDAGTWVDYAQIWKFGGSIVTTGDQVISSDINLKTNLQDVTYGVEDIAKTRAVTFDWKDGRGKSAGSIAQDWKPLIPELVHGEEGNMTLAYGQIALVNSILLAKHETEQDKEIKQLKDKVAKQNEEILRLKARLQLN